MARPKGLPKTGGRKAGTPNKATGEVRALAQEYTEAAIHVLAEIMMDETAPHLARIRAAEALLDRSHGRPTQHVETKVSPIEGMSDEELAHALAVLKAMEASSTEDDLATGAVAGSA